MIGIGIGIGIRIGIGIGRLDTDRQPNAMADAMPVATSTKTIQREFFADALLMTISSARVFIARG